MKEYEIFNPDAGLLSDPEKIRATSPARAAEIWAKSHGIKGKAVRHLYRYGGDVLVTGAKGSYLYDFI